MTIWSRQEGKYSWLGLRDCDRRSGGDVEEERIGLVVCVCENTNNISSRDLVCVCVRALARVRARTTEHTLYLVHIKEREKQYILVCECRPHGQLRCRQIARPWTNYLISACLSVPSWKCRMKKR